MGKKRRQRQRLGKLLSKLLRAQGPDIVVGLATGIVTNLITDGLAERIKNRKGQA